MLYLPTPGSNSNALPSELSEALENKNLVFTVSTGRSGTNLFCDVFKLANDTVSLHEPKPNFAENLNFCSRNVAAAKRFLIDKKLPAIVSHPNVNYVETSHLFCKAFLSPLIELGVNPKILFIHRSARDVAKSFYHINSIPGRTKLGKDFMLLPHSPSVLPIATPMQDLHDYQLCFWYALEIYARSYIYKKFFDSHGITYSSIEFPQELNSEKVRNVFNELGLSTNAAESELDLVLGKKVNEKSNIKKSHASNTPSVDYEALEKDLFEKLFFLSEDFKKHMKEV